MTQASNFRADFIAEQVALANEQIAELQAKLKSYDNVLLGEGWVIVHPAMSTHAFNFKANSEHQIVSHTTHHLFGGGFRMLTEADARRVAENVTNGHGDKAQAKHIRDALQDAIADRTNDRDAISALAA